MNNFHTALIFLVGFVSSSLFQISAASVVSTGNFNKDFFVIWSPTHVNTSADGHTRSMKLDQESGTMHGLTEILAALSKFITEYSFLNYSLNYCRGWFCFEPDVFVWAN